ncbi:unnamed protein product [Staurois parvus]|nr:unnamed protein product [Staurois parvus]
MASGDWLDGLYSELSGHWLDEYGVVAIWLGYEYGVVAIGWGYEYGVVAIGWDEYGVVAIGWVADEYGSSGHVGLG